MAAKKSWRAKFAARTDLQVSVLETSFAGASAHAVTPFWRLVDPGSPLAARLSCGVDRLKSLHSAEAAPA